MLDQIYQRLVVGQTVITPDITDGFLRSLGAVHIGDTSLRNPATRFLPWLDSYEGELFRCFQFDGITVRGDETILSTRALSDPDALLRERRDSSGDLCFRNANWDDAPREAAFSVHFLPVQEIIDDHRFTGFKYWFDYTSTDIPIHRLVDRQTWEIGGNLDDVTLCLRNWLTPPRMRITQDTVYSTVGLDKWAGLLPGNLWGRWTLLPSFDMQYGKQGILLGWFDEISLIRTVIESNAGEDCLRFLDMHLFTQDTKVSTNPKTILWSPDVLDDVDALNLWTRIHDREQAKACRQFDIRQEEPPAIVFSHNVWKDIRFDSTYEDALAVAKEFGADYLFIDPVWEHQQAFKETLDSLIPPEKQQGTILDKFWQQNMCVTLDFEVADIMGGEAKLKALCDRARANGIKILSWMATHYSPNSSLQHQTEFRHGETSIFAARESGRHPDTGYPASCWTANLNGPIGDHMKQQLLGVCQRTGMAGFLWDSFCNLGWWQLDYSDGSMRPQYDKMAELYRELTHAGLYLMPEAIVTFSNHSCCGLHGGNVYADDLLGYSYNTNIALWFGGDDSHAGNYDNRVLMGEEPFDLFFQCIAHKRVPSLGFHLVPREQWHQGNVELIKEILRVYKQNRHLMMTRIVVKDQAGVFWENDTKTNLYFSFKDQPSAFFGEITDAGTGMLVTDDRLRANRVYLIK